MAVALQDLSRLLDQARRAGARAGELFLTEESGVDADVVRGRIGTRREVLTSSLRVRCWADEAHMAEVVGRPEKAPQLLEQALAAARSAPEDPFGGPVGRLPMVTRGLGILDRRFEQLELGDRLDVVLAAERGARTVDRRVQTNDFAYSDRLVRRVFASSQDLVVEEIGTLFHAAGSVLVARSDAVVELSAEVRGRSYASISSLPYGAVIAKKAVDLIDAPPLSLSGRLFVMLPPDVTARIFERLAKAFSMAALRSGESLFSAGFASGEPVVSPAVHLLDDGSITGGLRTRVFDEEGAPPIPLVLLREGIVDGGFTDLRLSRELDTLPTGHLTTSGLQPSNLMLRSGTRSMSALLSEHADLEVFVADHVEGIDHIDLKTGEFRWLASGLVNKGQEVLGGALRVPLSGNILDVLSRVVDVASDTDRIGHVDAPGMLVEGIGVSGS